MNAPAPGATKVEDRAVGTTHARLAELVGESLRLWGVAARVTAHAAAAPSGSGSVLRIEGPGALLLSVALADPEDEPIRWWLCWHAREAGTDRCTIVRRKPCASALGLLRTLRESFGIAAGPRVRIALGAAPGPSA